MKKKSLLALGAVSLVGLGLTVALPLSLTSCSGKTNQHNNNPGTSNPTTPVNENIQIQVGSNETDYTGDQITLTVKADLKDAGSGQQTPFGYQWYYKQKTPVSLNSFSASFDTSLV